jgi:hypothetical protein
MTPEKIPEELRSLRQWVACGVDKVPKNPRTGGPASTTNPATWGTFEEACARGTLIGFVFTDSDPYTGIDLDDKPTRPATEDQKARFGKILEVFDSYTETSTSGRGVHITVRGKVPTGIHGRDGVEVYSTARYFVMTGNSIGDRPIADRQGLLDKLYGEMRPAPTTDLDESDLELMDDRDLVEMACEAENGAKFTALCNGKWQELGYPSQSEADFALMSMFAFYSRDNEQCRRLFRMTALGKREKAMRDNVYLNRSLRKIRAGEPDPVDPSALVAQAAAVCRRATVEAPPPPPVATVPEARAPPLDAPGLIGELARYIHASSTRPVSEVAVVSALGFVAGVAGRCFNTHPMPTGLNLYLILLGKTGVGKEGGKQGLNRVVAAVRPTVPAIGDFVGPSRFASGEALHNRLSQQPCFYSVWNEIGHTLQRITNPRASHADQFLHQALLETYSMSGRDNVMGEGAYASSEKNTKIVVAPAVTIIGDSTPETFFGGLDESHLASGFVPRFLVVEYPGDRPNQNPHAGQPPPGDLVVKVADLAATCSTMTRDNRFVQVPPDSDGHRLLSDFNKEVDDKIRGSDEAHRQAWNRAHLNALKVASLLAVGCNHHDPRIIGEHALWAINLVRRSVACVLSRFETGEVGGGEMNKARAEVMKKAREFNKLSPDKLVKYGVHESMIGKVIPFTYFSRRLVAPSGVRPFSEKGGSDLLAKTLKEMVESGELAKPTAEELRVWGIATSKPIYTLGRNWN